MRNLTFLICAIILSGCVSSSSQASLSNKTDYQICKSLVKIDHGEWKGLIFYAMEDSKIDSAAVEKRRRNLDCRKYQDRIDRYIEEMEIANASKSNNYYSSSNNSGDSSVARELRNLKRSRSFSCINKGGVMVGDTCM